MNPGGLDACQEWLAKSSPIRWTGSVLKVSGNLIESAGPLCSVGDRCDMITSRGVMLEGEVVGFRGSTMLSMTLEKPEGLRYGDSVTTRGTQPSMRVGPELLGRVIDSMGRPLDGRPDFRAHQFVPLDGSAPLPFERLKITEPLGCGVRAIDAFMTCGRGQRMGIFGGSGVGKSTLIGMMARGAAADLTVIALVGERGREVGEFLDALREAGRKRSILVVSTSDQAPLLRIRAAMAATAIAEYFGRSGKNVLLVVDSLTRLAMAQREIGLAAGEPPTTKGYTPSVLSLLARLSERAGRFRNGSITAFYTVLMEGDDQQDPVVDTVRSLLDGHIVLDRSLSARNHYPPISVLDSLSRLMPGTCSREHLEAAAKIRLLLSAYSRTEDLIRIGAYQQGTDTVIDRAIAVLPALNAFLQQSPDKVLPLPDTVKQLLAISC